MPIFGRFLNATQARADGRGFEAPAGLEVVSVDPRTGLAASEACGGEPEFFLPGTAPPETPGGCWGVPRVPAWVANAEGRVAAGVRSLLRELGRRLGRVFR
jgi:hypothetical protein